MRLSTAEKKEIPELDDVKDSFVQQVTKKAKDDVSFMQMIVRSGVKSSSSELTKVNRFIEGLSIEAKEMVVDSINAFDFLPADKAAREARIEKIRSSRTDRANALERFNEKLKANQMRFNTIDALSTGTAVRMTWWLLLRTDLIGSTVKKVYDADVAPGNPGGLRLVFNMGFMSMNIHRSLEIWTKCWELVLAVMRGTKLVCGDQDRLDDNSVKWALAINPNDFFKIKSVTTDVEVSRKVKLLVRRILTIVNEGLEGGLQGVGNYRDMNSPNFQRQFAVFREGFAKKKLDMIRRLSPTSNTKARPSIAELKLALYSEEVFEYIGVAAPPKARTPEEDEDEALFDSGKTEKA